MIVYEKFTAVKMTRETRFIELGSSWEHQVFPIRDPAVLDEIWREWAAHEAVKRYLLVFCPRARAYESSHLNGLQFGLFGILSRPSASYLLLATAVVLARGICFVSTMRRTTVGGKDIA